MAPKATSERVVEDVDLGKLSFSESAELPKSKRTSKFDKLAEQLRANPGKVGRYGPVKDGSAAVTALKRLDGIDAVSRSQDGKLYVFAVFNGETETEAPAEG